MVRRTASMCSVGTGRGIEAGRRMRSRRVIGSAASSVGPQVNVVPCAVEGIAATGSPRITSALRSR